MNSNALDQELKKIRSELHDVTNLYSEALSNKDYDKRKFFEEKINFLLKEIKIKTKLYDDLQNKN